MKLYLIRHGMTAGNLQRRYIGKTDEPLCPEGITELRKLEYTRCERLVCSPMKRCIETALMLFPGQDYITCQKLRECDFGEFEGRNYLELGGNEYYQRWIDSGGELPFPGGESPCDFRERCVTAFDELISGLRECRSLAMVVHGGTIMSILERYAVPHRSYFDWQTENGHGWKCESDGKILTVLEKL